MYARLLPELLPPPAHVPRHEPEQRRRSLPPGRPARRGRRLPVRGGGTSVCLTQRTEEELQSAVRVRIVLPGYVLPALLCVTLCVPVFAYQGVDFRVLSARFGNAGADPDSTCLVKSKQRAEVAVTS